MQTQVDPSLSFQEPAFFVGIAGEQVGSGPFDGQLEIPIAMMSKINRAHATTPDALLDLQAAAKTDTSQVTNLSLRNRARLGLVVLAQCAPGQNWPPF
jgi:hypothetical protein